MTRMVTPGYAPPEQYALDARCGPPADIYGLAATLYWTLTARAPTPAIDRQTGTPLTPPYRIIESVSKDDVGRRARRARAESGTSSADESRRSWPASVAARPGPPCERPGGALPAAAGPDVTRADGTRSLPSPPVPLPVPPSIEPGRRKALVATVRDRCSPSRRSCRSSECSRRPRCSFCRRSRPRVTRSSMCG